MQHFTPIRSEFRKLRHYFAAGSCRVPKPTEEFFWGSAPLSEVPLILVVDDDQDVLELAVATLTDVGFRVNGASAPEAALEVLRTTPEVDLLLTDIVMPGAMSGFALARAARQIRPDLRILYTSGYAEDLVEGTERYGRLIAKPWRIDTLHRGVREALSEPPTAA